MRKVFIALFVASAVLAPSTSGAQDPLASARELYAAAEYENALRALDEARIKPGLPADVRLSLEQYRALCLLAVGRKADAEKAIEAVLDLDPFYEPREEDAAPWVRTAFREVRQRVLPATLQQLYGRGKQAFERKSYPEARDAFKQVMRVLDDPALSLDEGAQADMRLVVQGFLDLADAAAQAQAAAAAPVETPEKALPVPNVAANPPPASGDTPATPSGAVKPGAGAAGTKTLPAAGPRAEDKPYDASSVDVIPPLPLRQTVALPAMLRPNSPKEGVIDIVIGVDGTVESAVITQSFGQILDRFVQDAVTSWRYRAATRAGTPVRFRRVVRLVLPARQQ